MTLRSQYHVRVRRFNKVIEKIRASSPMRLVSACRLEEAEAKLDLYHEVIKLMADAPSETDADQFRLIARTALKVKSL